jgi:dihydroorotase
MSIEQVIACTTVNSALAMRKPELGTLNAGAPADVAMFRLEEGDFTFQDIHLNERSGGKLLVSTMTMIDGDVLPRVADLPLQPWAALPDHQRGKVKPVRNG